MRLERTVTIAGREVTPEDALRLEVVRGVLMGTMTLAQGANQLRIPMFQLSRLVNGARVAVIRALGEDALVRAREEAVEQSLHERAAI
jgi:hypothetical protein